jgi:hypothetical protein
MAVRCDADNLWTVGASGVAEDLLSVMGPMACKASMVAHLHDIPYEIIFQCKHNAGEGLTTRSSPPFSTLDFEFTGAAEVPEITTEDASAAMNFTQIDATLGFSQLLSQLTGGAPADPMEPLSFAKLRDGMPSAGMMFAAGSTALAGYALWEQIKFRMYRAGKKGMLAGEQGAGKARSSGAALIDSA